MGWQFGITPETARAVTGYFAGIGLLTSVGVTLAHSIAVNVMSAPPGSVTMVEYKPLSRVDTGLRQQARAAERPAFNSKLLVRAMAEPETPPARLAVALDSAETAVPPVVKPKRQQKTACKSKRCSQKGLLRVSGKRNATKKRAPKLDLLEIIADPAAYVDRYAGTTAEITERGLRSRG